MKPIHKLPSLSNKIYSEINTNKTIVSNLFCLLLLLLSCATFAKDDSDKNKINPYPKWFAPSNCTDVQVVPLIDKTKKNNLDDAYKTLFSVYYHPHKNPKDILLKQKIDNSWWILLNEWKQLSSLIPSITEQDSKKNIWVELNLKNNVVYRVDACSSEMWIQIGAEDVTNIDLTNGQILPTTPASFGAYLNLSGNYGGFSGAGHGSGEIDFGSFKGLSAFKSGLLLGNGSPKRLDNYFSFDNPDTAQELIVGDSITKTLGFEPNSRFAGIQYGTNYALQPKRITFPLPIFTGSAALPSTADIFLNGQKMTEEPVPSGSYKLVGIPTLSGAGDLTILLRDPLGNEQSVSLPFYASTSLLAKGLDNNTYEVGTLRENYALNNDQYDHIFATTTLQHGFTNYFTGGMHLEASDYERMIGGMGIFKVNTFGLVTVSMAGSQATSEATQINPYQYIGNSNYNSNGGIGYLSSISFERTTQNLSYSFKSQYASSKYADLGRALGSLQLENDANISYNAKRLGSVSLVYSQQKSWNNISNSFIGTGYNVSVNRWVNLQASYIKSITGPDSQTLFISGIVLFGNGSSASVGFQNNLGQLSERYQVQKSPQGPLGWGYNAVVDNSQPGEKQFDVNYTGTKGTIGGGLAGINGNLQPALEAKTGLAYLDNSIFWTRPVDNSFTVVDTQLPHVHVYQDNLDVGQTGDNGKLLVPNLRPFQENKIGIDVSDIPIKNQFVDSEKIVVPPAIAGVKTTFEIDTSQTVSVKIKQEDQTPIPAGATVSLDDKVILLPSGFDGLVYLEVMDGQHTIGVQWANGTCSAKLKVQYGVAVVQVCKKN